MKIDQKKGEIIVKQVKVRLNSIDEVKEFCGLTNACKFDVDLLSGRYRVDAKSIMGIFSLDLTKTLEMLVHAEDAECADFLDDMKKFIEE